MTVKSWLLAILVALSFAIGGGAGEACETPPEAGVWVSRDAALNRLSSLEVIHFCVPDRRFGTWKVRAKSRCHPRDCTWGWSPAQRCKNDRLHGGFQRFFSIGYVWMRVIGERAEVEVRIVYNDSSREDETYVVTLERK